MAIIKCELDEQKRGIKTDQENKGTYELTWKIIVDDPDHSGLTVLELARLVSAPNDPVPQHGDVYFFLDGEDAGSYALGFECDLLDDEDPLNWYVKVDYKPLPKGKSEQQTQEKDPMKWDPEYWVEFVEEQVPIEEARCMTTLSALRRGPVYAQLKDVFDYDPNAPVVKGKRLAKYGPIVNAAGQQTVDPQTKVEYRTIICALINCASYLDAIALNARFMNTTNIDTFLDAPPRSWKFLGATPDKRQEKEVPGIGKVVYYPTTVKLEFKKEYPFDPTDAQNEGAKDGKNGWDLKLLNNGQVCLRHTTIDHTDYITDPETQKPALLHCQVKQPKASLLEALEVDPNYQPTTDDFELVDASEPVNLKLDGSQITNPEEKAKYIYYRYLNDVAYSELTYNNGYQQVQIF